MHILSFNLKLVYIRLVLIKLKFNSPLHSSQLLSFPPPPPPPLQAKAEEDLQETRGQIDAMLEGLSSLSAPAVKAAATKCSTSPEDVIDGRLSSTQPEGALQSHTDMLQVRHGSMAGFYCLHYLT